MAPAFVVGLIAVAVHAPLGIEVLKRRIIFIDLALAQVVGLAIILLGLWFEEPSWLVLQLASFGAGIAVAWFFRWVERKTPGEQEAVIGSSFILAASMALLVLTDNPHGGEELRNVLSGQILFVSWSDIASFLPVYALVSVIWFVFPRARKGGGFFVLFALAVTASVQLVGVYVVFASLILPALASRTRQGYALGWAYASGALAVIVAILVSTAADLPAGPFLVVCFAASAIATRVLFQRAHALYQARRSESKPLVAHLNRPEGDEA